MGAVREINLVCMSSQGSVQTMEILARTFYEQYGYHVASQVFPGTRSKSSPVVSYLKAGPERIPIASPNYNPDDVLVFWDGLLRVAGKRAHPVVADAIGRLRTGNLIVNTTLAPTELDLPFKFRGTVAAVDATGVAKEVLKRDPPPVGIVMAGAYIAVTHALDMEVFFDVVREHFPGRLGEQNVEAARVACERLQIAPEVVSLSDAVLEDEPPVDPMSLPIQPPLQKRPMPGLPNGDPHIWRTSIPICEDGLCACNDMCLSEVMCPDNTGFIVRHPSLAGPPHQGYRIDVDHCRGCGICAEVCVYSAIHMFNETEIVRTNPNYGGITVEPFFGARQGVKGGVA